MVLPRSAITARVIYTIFILFDLLASYCVVLEIRFIYIYLIKEKLYVSSNILAVGTF
jgi:hypothetical protein